MSVRRNEPDLYHGRCEAWWSEADPFARSLREVNRFRLAVLRRILRPLPPGALVVDLGCGGGLITVPLARSGVRVIGVDPESDGLRAAKRRAGSYAVADGRRAPLADGTADLVCLADVVEHLRDWPRLLAEAGRIARPGAWLYVSTIRSGVLARAQAVWLAEGLGLVPRGTHDAGMFVSPRRLREEAATSGWHLRGLVGLAPRPLATLRHHRLRLRATRRISAEYSAWFQLA